MADLRPYQQQGISDLRDAFARGLKRIVFKLPTGGGKTVIAEHIIKMATSKGKRVAFVCNRIELANQTSRRFAQAGIAHGLMQGQNSHSIHSQVMVCSIQTMSRRRAQDFDLIIIDECHGVAGSTAYKDLIFSLNNVPVVGLTATPYSKGMAKYYEELKGPLFQEVVIGATISDLIDDKFLVDVDIFAPEQYQPDLSNVKIVAGDYDETELAEAVDKPRLVGDIVAHWKKLGRGKPTIVFATNIAHSKHICQMFNEAGITAEHVDYRVTDEDRAAILDRVRRHETTILCNPALLAEGLDIPQLEVMILARPTKSLIRYIQQAGRILRPYESKTCLERGTLVLTDCGEVEIQNITLDHKLWDGHNFVSHDGAICNGVRPVMTYDGITATCDHEVMTNEGWKTLADANRRGLRITRSGIGGRPVRIVEDRVERGSGGELQSAGSSGVRPVRRAAHGPIPQHEKTAEHGRLPALQWQGADYGSALAVPEVPSPAVAVSERVRCAVSFVRRAWNRISIRWAELCSKVGCRHHWGCRPIDAAGSDRQQRPLRAWESAVGVSGSEREQQSSRQRREDEVSGISTEPTGSQVCGQNACQDDSSRNVGCGNCGEMGDAFGQTEREVWDVLNVGPLQRFTANGRLVHNCALILDHSGTCAKLGFPTDDHEIPLCDGKPKKTGEGKPKEKLPSVCGSCGVLKQPGVHECPSCGFKPERKSEIETEEGELKPMSRKDRTALPMEAKQAIYSALIGWVLQRKPSPNWAYYLYEEMMGAKPANTLDKKAGPMIETVAKWLQHRNIAFAHSQKKAKARREVKCPKCGSNNLRTSSGTGPHAMRADCNDCKAVWWLSKEVVNA